VLLFDILPEVMTPIMAYMSTIEAVKKTVGLQNTKTSKFKQ
jgi:hypothetical protein